jgi:hypothetical protein
MAYVYRHVRLDTNEVFYIGIGSDIDGQYIRANSNNKRSEYWKKIVKKAGYEVQIMLDDLTWEEACIKEIEFIKLYGRKDLNEGTLCNLTDGGDGALGLIYSEESRKKMSDIKKEQFQNKPWLKYSKIGSKHTDETKKKMSEKRLGKKHTEETIDKIRKSNTGNKNWVNKTHKEESKIKISEALRGKKRSMTTVTCPHCNISGAGPNMSRYHFDNCKQARGTKPSDPFDILTS